MKLVTELSIPQARRIALAAHGFGARPATVGASEISAIVARLEALQLDSVNVFERSHYLPIFSRLGNYDTRIADQLLMDHAAQPSHLEYWAHVAAFIPTESWPLWRWKMAEFRDKHHAEGGWLAEHQRFAAEMLALVEAEGPITASDVQHERNGRTGAWWGWSDAKRALEYMFDAGFLTSAGRRGFQRLYALPERVLPRNVFESHPTRDDAITELVLRATTSVGVGTDTDIADYFRLPKSDTRRALRQLVESGSIDTVRVAGWDSLAYMRAGTAEGLPVVANTVLTPFDPVTWNRDRARRLFDFDYTIEIYVPAAQRRFGYYSLPVLMDESLVARIDLKADRKARTLIVKSAHWQQTRPGDSTERLAQVVRDAAQWRGLEHIVVDDWGDASTDLRSVLG